jgi:hypothetical protein
VSAMEHFVIVFILESYSRVLQCFGGAMMEDTPILNGKSGDACVGANVGG